MMHDPLKVKEKYFQLEVEEGYFMLDAATFLKEWFDLPLNQLPPWEREENPSITEEQAMEVYNSPEFDQYCAEKIDAASLEDMFEYEDDPNKTRFIPFIPKPETIKKAWDESGFKHISTVWQASNLPVVVDGIDFEGINQERMERKAVKQAEKQAQKEAILGGKHDGLASSFQTAHKMVGGQKE